jgi:hypothetical protein
MGKCVCLKQLAVATVVVIRLRGEVCMFFAWGYPLSACTVWNSLAPPVSDILVWGTLWLWLFQGLSKQYWEGAGKGQLVSSSFSTVHWDAKEISANAWSSASTAHSNNTIYMVFLKIQPLLLFLSQAWTKLVDITSPQYFKCTQRHYIQQKWLLL